jgi:hypothetical protein
MQEDPKRLRIGADKHKFKHQERPKRSNPFLLTKADKDAAQIPETAQ